MSAALPRVRAATPRGGVGASEDAAAVASRCVPAAVASRRVPAALLAGVFLCAALLAAPGTAWGLWSYDGNVDASWYDASQDTFHLSTEAQLAGLSSLVSQGETFVDKTVVLDADIDLSSCEWEPIGDPYDAGKAFEGVFDGAGHAVVNLRIDAEEQNQALFARVSDAVVKNLAVHGSVTCSQGASGIISQADRSQFFNLTNYADVNAEGIYGSSYEKSYNGNAAGVVCYSTALKGDGAELRYENLVNYGSIRATAPSGNGGVCGALMAGEGSTYVLSGCKNYGSVYVALAQNVEDVRDGVGGVVGATSDFGTYKILNCGNEGDVFANNLGSVGGLAGSVRGSESVIDHSYNTGSVTNMGVDFNAPTEDLPTAGGLVSQFESEGGTVSNNYSTGTVSSSTGHSAAIIGASSYDMASIASNNYYLEGSSTGAFNDQATGDSSDAMLSGEVVTADELAEKVDNENGGVLPPDLSAYSLTEVSGAESEPAPTVQVPEAGSAIATAVAALALLAVGVMYESARFARKRRSNERQVG